MAFTRRHLLMKHTSGSILLAFAVPDPDQYAGGTDFKFEQLGRNGAGDLVRVTLASTKRDWQGMVYANENGGTVTYDPGAVEYTLGSPAQLKAALVADDLEVKSFEDTSFWEARPVGQHGPRLFRSVGDMVTAPLRLIEK